LIVAIGLYPRPVLDPMGPTLQAIDKISHGKNGERSKPSDGEPAGNSGRRPNEKIDQAPSAGSSAAGKKDQEKKQ
jgi:hypothetical protein